MTNEVDYLMCSSSCGGFRSHSRRLPQGVPHLHRTTAGQPTTETSYRYAASEELGSHYRLECCSEGFGPTAKNRFYSRWIHSNWRADVDGKGADRRGMRAGGCGSGGS